ncbi:tape measure protein [Agrobacterium tumefaciens]|uniref:Tape measure protein n=1 Tax=Agrobacterium tumefaciens TaxID=358 RepID=A0AA44F295_AGRTU|nr:tape measure protein [Agrobacterium tumefaciens]NSL20569.1 tape measure protein [Agrobacterium tumefaciens]NTB85032.1 tape measure protein [Agrobacterium tumefaciens]NTC15563.1 tape measure protein [Agrobacterium tumefaciens]NTC28082.1 tape measure protein [Agrobacterium tumefaciens]NTC54932.1 tape measure protein [Agrobacterium tumefaciens]
MATDLERLVVQLSADVKGYQNALNRAQGITNRQARAIESRFASMNKRLSSSYSELAAGAAKVFALIGGAQGFRQLSDSATRIDNSLKVAGLSGEALEGVYQKLFVAAQKNAAPLETLVQLYGRVSLVQNELGVSSDQIIKLSNNVALALRASGQSSQEASGALLQLSQALGAGVVRAEEFNSIQEGAPTILQAAAAGIQQAGGSVAKLRQIMLDGNLSSKAFFDGINAGAPVLEQKVASAVLTVDQRLENLRTALTNATREFNTSSNAANTFGSAIDNMADFVNSVDMDGLAADISAIIELLNSGAVAAQGFAEWIGRISGLQNIGGSIIGAFDSNGDGKLSAFGGALMVNSTVKASDKLVDNTEKRLSLERQIAEIKANPMNVLGQAEIRQLEGQIKGLQETATKTASTIIQNTLNNVPLKYPTAAPTIAATNAAAGGKTTVSASGGAKFTPIDITDPQYKVTSSGSGKRKSGGGSSRQNEYQREIEQIQQRTAALQAQTSAQAAINPLVNDYGYAVEFARSKQDLLTAAQEAGITITPELTASIEQLASGYAKAVVESERLAESQDKARQAAEDFKNTAKDITSGFISDLRSGTSAAEALSNALNRVLDKVIDIGLNSIFGLGGGGGLFSFLGFKKGGKIPAFAGGGKLSGPGTGTSDSMLVRASKGEYIVNAKATKAHLALLEAINGGKLPAFATGGLLGGGIAPKAPSLPSVSNLPSGRSSKDTVSIVLQDDSGRMASIADQRIETATGTIVNVAVAQSSRAAPAAMAQYQNSKGGAGWR